MLNAMLEQIWARKFVFLGTFFVVFTLSYIVLVAIDYLPESPAEDVDQTESIDEVFDLNSNQAGGPVAEASETVARNTGEETIEVAAPVGEAAVADEQLDEPTPSEDEIVSSESDQAIEVAGGSVLPVSIHIEKLDKTVTVLNPNSRTIADLDNALLKGVVRHPDSANLAQEGNVFILGHSSYLPQVFNKNFQAFNGIQNLAWGDTIEVYSDDSVYKYRVEKVYRAQAQDVTVPIAGTGNKLTLATCNSFGSTDDRYIVEAKRIDVRKL